LHYVITGRNGGKYVIKFFELFLFWEGVKKVSENEGM